MERETGWSPFAWLIVFASGIIYPLSVVGSRFPLVDWRELIYPVEASATFIGFPVMMLPTRAMLNIVSSIGA